MKCLLLFYILYNSTVAAKVICGGRSNRNACWIDVHLELQRLHNDGAVTGWPGEQNAKGVVINVFVGWKQQVWVSWLSFATFLFLQRPHSNITIIVLSSIPQPDRVTCASHMNKSNLYKTSCGYLSPRDTKGFSESTSIHWSKDSKVHP